MLCIIAENNNISTYRQQGLDPRWVGSSRQGGKEQEFQRANASKYGTRKYAERTGGYGIGLLGVLQASNRNPKESYKLPIGILRNPTGSQES